MAILDGINSSSDIKQLKNNQLCALADELRERIISAVKKNGGHLSSNLGVVEATVAMHYVFDFPKDKLIFDVGHQCYAHKILTGRKDRFETIRMDNGLSGFPDREESEYDAFSTGHAGTSLAVGLGYCMGRDRLGEDYCVVNLVGDGSFINGLNLEAINTSNVKPKNFIVILNDNGMSISKNHNGLYKLISKGTIKKSYIKSKRALKKVFGNSFVTRGLKKFRELLKRIFNKNNYFEQFGFKYVGLVDGNDISELIDVLKRAKETAKEKAVLLHIRTTKGKGLEQAEEQSEMYHGVGRDLIAKESVFSEKLGQTLNTLIEKDKSIIAITAGMKYGTGLACVEAAHPDNFLDVGIAEEYAVTLSAGMASGGLKPVVVIYSTFMQRAYDQILHDVCLQKLPVVMCLDRAGLTGPDGKTHQGVFDLSFLTHLPNINVFAPADVEELAKMLEYAITLSEPVAIRYPSEKTSSVREYVPINNRLWVTVRDGSDVVLLAVGPRMLSLAERVAEKSDRSVKVVNARTVKPLDEKTLDEISAMPIITLEENSVIGGFGAYVAEYYARENVPVRLQPMGIKDEFIAHGTLDAQLELNGLTEENIKASIEKLTFDDGKENL